MKEFRQVLLHRVPAELQPRDPYPPLYAAAVNMCILLLFQPTQITDRNTEIKC